MQTVRNFGRALLPPARPTMVAWTRRMPFVARCSRRISPVPRRIT
jgi:hypothetical protein